TRGATLNNQSDGQFLARSAAPLATDSGAYFVNAGIVDLGTSVFNCTWSFSQSSTGRLNVPIKSATSFGQLVTSRDLALAGSINAVLTSAYLPPANTLFKVIRHGARSGTFGAVGTLGSDNRFFTATYNPADVTLTTGQPSLSVKDVRVTEDSATGLKANFVVSLSAARSVPITVQYATANGTNASSAATAGSDYTAASGTLTFAPGEKSKTVGVAILSDLLNEPEETYLFKLSNATNAAISDAEAVGFIVDNDATPTLSINDVAATEGNGGVQTPLSFTVTLSAKSAKTITVKFATANGTAVAGPDYVAQSGALTFAPGETSKTVKVLAAGDSLDENDETFGVQLSAGVNAGIARAKGVGTIKDDDSSAISVNSPSITEGNASVDTGFTSSDRHVRGICHKGQSLHDAFHLAVDFD
ncbi:MAG: hypothetical protein EON57_13650, partial [Alphaproteobacteria bacterium]